MVTWPIWKQLFRQPEPALREAPPQTDGHGENRLFPAKPLGVLRLAAAFRYGCADLRRRRRRPQGGSKLQHSEGTCGARWNLTQKHRVSRSCSKTGY